MEKSVSPEYGNAPASSSRPTRSLPSRGTRRRQESGDPGDLGGTLQLVESTGVTDEDDTDDDDDEGGGKKRKKGKGGATRRAIRIEYIGDKSRRNITFTKRKNGIIKKAHEISILTGCEVLLLVASRDTDQVFTFTTTKLQPLTTDPAGRANIQNCLRYGSMSSQNQPPPPQGPLGSPPDRSGFLPTQSPVSGAGSSSMPAPRVPMGPPTTQNTAAPSTYAAQAAYGVGSPERRFTQLDPFRREGSAPPGTGGAWDDSPQTGVYGSSPTGPAGPGASGPSGNSGAHSNTSWRPSPLGPGGVTRSPASAHTSLRGQAAYGSYNAQQGGPPTAGNMASPIGGGWSGGPPNAGAGPMTRSQSAAGASAGGASSHSPGSAPEYLHHAPYGRRSSEGDVSAAMHAYTSSDEQAGAGFGAGAGTRYGSSSESNHARSASASAAAGGGYEPGGGAATAAAGADYDSTPYMEPGTLPDNGERGFGGSGWSAGQ